MSEAFVLILALGDKSFKVLRVWTLCADCTGKRLETEASDARLFLFVFATKPAESQPSCQEVAPPEQESVGMSVCASQALMVSHSLEHVDSAETAPPLLQSIDCSECEFFSCDESPQHEQHPTPPEYAHVGPHLVEMYANGPLRRVQDQVQDMPWSHRKAGEIHRYHHLHCQAGLRVHHGTRSDGFRHNDLACHRRSYPRGRRRDRAAQVQGGVPLRHPEGDFGTAPAAPQGAASGTTYGAGAEYFQLYGQCSSSSDEAEDCGDCDSRTSQSCPGNNASEQHPHDASCSDFLPAKDFASDFASSCNTRLQHDHEGREADDQRGVWCSTQCGCERRHHGEALDRAGAGVGGPGSRTLGPCSVASASGDSASIDLAATPASTYLETVAASPARTEGPAGYNPDSPDSWERVCGVDCLAPPQHSVPEPSDDSASGTTRWPTLSPEVGLEVPLEDGIEVPKAWQAVGALDMSRRATRALLQKWLGPKAWKIAKGSSVGLIELYTGRGRLSDSYELVCNGSEAIRLGHMYGQPRVNGSRCR